MNTTMKKQSGRGMGVINGTKIFLSMVFIALVIVPIGIMFSNIDSQSIKNVVNNPNFSTTVLNSLKVGLIATTISVVLGYLLAVCVYRSGITHKDLFGILFTLPMLVPSISLGMGLIILFGNNGIVTKLFGQVSGIYGMWGIILGSVLYSLPVAYLMFADVLKYEDASPYEAAKVLGISRLRQFAVITFPYLKKPLISIIFATFTLIVTDYGVPMAVGGGFKTIPQVMYEEVSLMEFGKGAVWGTLLLIPAVIAFIIDIVNKDRGNSGFVTKVFENANSKLEKTVAYCICSLVAVFTVSPAVSFVFLGFTKGYPNKLSFSLENIKDVVTKSSKYLGNSVVMAVLVAAFGCAIAFLTAYLSARMKSKTSRFLHMSSITSAAIPGLVLGLAYAMTFAKTPIYNTMLILVMVNTVHFISSPYLMMYNSFSKINGNLESVGETLGISRLRMIKDVFLPQSINTIVEMFSYFFVNCMMTISAVSFLSTTSTKPLSLLINQYKDLSKPEIAAVVSLFIFVVNLSVKGIFRLIKSRNKR